MFDRLNHIKICQNKFKTLKCFFPLSNSSDDRKILYDKRYDCVGVF